MPNRSVNLVVSHLAIQPEEEYTNTKIKTSEANINIQKPKIEIEQKNINIGNLEVKDGDADINMNNKIGNLGNVGLKFDNDINNLGNLKIGADDEEKGEINIKMPKIEIKNNVEVKKNLSNINIEQPKLGGNLKITKKEPTSLRFKAIKDDEVDENFGLNLKVDMNKNSDKENSDSEDNKENTLKANPSEKGNIIKKGKGLPKVGTKMNNFQSSKIDVAGKLNTDNIDINNMKSANVGINGVKLGERIIE